MRERGRLECAAMDQMLVFGPTFEGLFQRALGNQIDSGTKDRLKAAGVDVDLPLAPTYPFDTWMQAIAICAEGVHPSLAPVEARRQLGRALVTGYRQTLVGRALLRFVKFKGTRKMLDGLRNTLRSGNNYSEVTIKDLSPTSVEIWTNVVGPYPEFTAGILEAGVEESGASSWKVEVAAHDGMAATYRVSWS
jgi:uncharacterized protein (TIGR02265 family)